MPGTSQVSGSKTPMDQSLEMEQDLWQASPIPGAKQLNPQYLMLNVGLDSGLESVQT